MIGFGTALILFGILFLYIANQMGGGNGVTAMAEFLPGCFGIILMILGTVFLLAPLGHHLFN